MRRVRSGVGFLLVLLGSTLGACGRSGLDTAPGDWGPIRPGGGSPTGTPDASPSPTGTPFPACVSDPDLLLCFGFEGDANNDGDLAVSLNVADLAYAAVGDGTSASFGQNSTINMSDDPALSSPATTVEFWMHPLELPGAGQRRGLVDKNGQYGIFLQDDATVTCTFEGSTARTPAASPLAAGAWSHIACSYDQALVRIYLDGVEVDTTNGNAPNGGADALHVAEDSPGGGDQFLGYLDVVRLWKRIRTPDEIALEAGRAMSQ